MGTPVAKRILLSVCLSSFFLPFMLAGVNAVLPLIGTDLHASATELGLMGTYYSLGLAISQLAGGRLGDILGRRRVFLTGLSIFSTCAFFLSITENKELFLALRLFQGIGASLFNAAGLALLASVAPPSALGRYISIAGTAVYAGIACGPPLAGLIAWQFHWRNLFLIIGIITALLTLLIYKGVKEEWRTSKGEPFDWLGCTIYAAAMAALTLGSANLHQHPLFAWSSLLLSVVLLYCFISKELRAPFPLLNIRLLRRKRVFGLSALASLINYSAFFGCIFYYSMYLQVVLGYDVRTAGFILAVQPLTQTITTLFLPRCLDRWYAGSLASFVAVICGAVIPSSILLGTGTPLLDLRGMCVFMCVGVCLFCRSPTTLLMTSAGQENIGQAAGVNGAVRTLGALCNMIIVTVTIGFVIGYEPIVTADPKDFLQSMHIDFMIFGVLNLMAVACSLVRNKN